MIYRHSTFHLILFHFVYLPPAFLPNTHCLPPEIPTTYDQTCCTILLYTNKDQIVPECVIDSDLLLQG